MDNKRKENLQVGITLLAFFVGLALLLGAAFMYSTPTALAIIGGIILVLSLMTLTNLS